MKLAVIHPDYSSQCLLCSWKYRAPPKRRKRVGVPDTLTPQERLKILEENVLSHLRYGHDRMLLTRDETSPEEPGMLGRIYYEGRRPERVRF